MERPNLEESSAMKYSTKQLFTKNTQAGFTLIELLMTLAVASIIMTQAIPSFSNMINENRLITQTNDLVADINLARSEAVTRGIQVVLCRSKLPRAITPTCGGAGSTAQTWTTGWLVYAESDGTTGFDSTDETLIRIGHPADSVITVMSDSTADTSLAYNADGTASSSAVFAICDSSGGTTTGRQINVNGVGRPRLTSGSIGDCTP
jgi:type IV fimbrial biogenesis protein FimT